MTKPQKSQQGQQSRREQLFLVRIWWEPSEATSTYAWRGRVEEVANGERTYFSSTHDLMSFIDGRLAVDDDPHRTAASVDPDEGTN